MTIAGHRFRCILRPSTLAAVALLTVGCNGAFAADRLVFGNPDYFCRNGAFPGGGEYEGPKPEFSLAGIKGSPGTKVWFLMDYGGSSVEKGCPKVQGQLCTSTKYLVPGDEVIVSKTRDGLACSWYETNKRFHETVGWLPLSSLEPSSPDENLDLTRWRGTWRNGDDTITLTEGGGHGTPLHVEGKAYWPARGAPDDSSGSIKGHGTPSKNVLKLEDGWGPGYSQDCGVRLTLLGRFLIAHDNPQCNGFNAKFDGVYLKAVAKP